MQMKMRSRIGGLGLAAIFLLGGVLTAKPFDPNAPKKPGADANTPKPTFRPTVPKLARRVVMVSLDGAGAETLQQLWRDDELDEGGFARFFREGQVAESLIPVNPSVTAPNHVSLVTGAAPELTGIVGNRFHPAGSPALSVSGFTFPIATETLWEAARRQKKYAAVMMWPTADGTSPQRRGDLGLTWPGGARRQSQILVLRRADWRPAAAAGPKLESRSPVLTAHLTLEGAKEGDSTGLDLFALERAGDGRRGYDSVVALAAASTPAPPPGTAGAPAGRAGRVVPVKLSTASRTAGGGTASGGAPAVTGSGAGGGKGTLAPTGEDLAAVQTLRQSQPLHAGEWAEMSLPEPNGRSLCWIKILSLDPTLETVRVYFSGTYPSTAYPADFVGDLAESNLAWPGVPDDPRLLAGWKEEPGNDQWIDVDTWVEQADHLAAYLGGAMRIAVERGDWHLMLGYIPVLDDAGHRLLLADPHQAGYSEARRDEYARARLKVWRAVDRELRLLLAEMDLGRTTVVVVSDHGMAPVHTAIDLNALLRARGWLAAPAASGGAAGEAADKSTASGGAAGGASAFAVGNGGMAHIYLAGRPGAGSPEEVAARRQLINDLRNDLLAWHVGDDLPIERVVNQQEAAELGLDNPNSGDLMVFAREGYMFDDGPAPSGTEVTHAPPEYGHHGYLSSNFNMHGIYLAIGKDVKPGSTTGAVSNVDVAGRIAAWLGIQKPRAGAH
jgi:predicted AlkP superfamily pyrophosphatase or phosphodiesterase